MFEKAKSIVIEKPRQAVLKEIPLAPIDDDTVVVQTTYSAISTGTEMKVCPGFPARSAANFGIRWCRAMKRSVRWFMWVKMSRTLKSAIA
jgi:hypothetical protein